MKIFLYLSFFLAVILLFFGFYLSGDDQKTAELCLGLGVCSLFFLWMPLFIYHRWKDKKVSDYMLNKENIIKMREHVDEKQNKR
ncbi:hypothetical protein SCB49_07272 [unidentified eubacterium SCB49]|nr:hypothetical protein SCB49_07272 [unidentified eubacterium SCB49]